MNEFFDRESSLSVKPVMSQTESNQTSQQEVPMEPRPAQKAERVDLKEVGRTKTLPIEEQYTNSPSKLTQSIRSALRPAELV